MSRTAAAAALLLVAAFGAEADGDVVRFSSGKTVRATAVRQGTRWRVNPYRSTLTEMTWGVVEYPLGDVANVERGDDPADLFRALDALGAKDLSGRLALLERAQRTRLEGLVRRLAAEILSLDPLALPAASVPAGSRKPARRDPHRDARLRPAARRVLRMASGLERRAAEEKAPVGLSALGLERRARSLREDRDARERVALRWDGAKHLGGTYAAFVPYDLDPLEAAPLVLALHGGGPSGTKSDVVVGAGKEALSLFVDGARRGRAIVVAPTALEWPWETPANEAFLLAVLEEAAIRWNVDLDRVHVAGQGDGADAALWLSSRHAPRFATVGCAGARADPALGLASRGLGVWLYHGERDAVVPVERARKVATALRKADADFAYTELPTLERGFPPQAEGDYWAFVLPRRRSRAADAWGRPSHDEPASPSEVAAFGPPDGAWGTTLPADADGAALLATLRRGLSEAEPAARGLLALRGEGTAAQAAAILADRSVPLEGRAWAAWLAGELRDPVATGALADAVRAERDPWLLGFLARALRTLGSADATQDLVSALRDAGGRHASRSGPGGSVPFFEYDRACRLLADLVEALGTIGADPTLVAEIEAAAVVGVFRDARTVTARAEAGEDPSEPRARLALACARAYRALSAEPTLYDMLRVSLRSDPAAVAAAARGAAEGLPRTR